MTAARPMLMLLHYDGGSFAGWQRQTSERTVQQELETVLARLTGAHVAVTGAGRTDAGVHAVGQVAAASVSERWHPGELVRALNALLPPDVWVERAQRMAPGFNPRRDATERTYCYRVGLDEGACSPFRRRYEWAMRPPLDQPLLARAAAMLEGEHGFRALAATGQEKAHWRCRVAEARWELRGEETRLEFWITADRFLHRMVRFLVGTMVEIARHRRPLADLAGLLDAEDNRAASPPAPPHGLFLVQVRFPVSCYADE